MSDPVWFAAAAWLVFGLIVALKHRRRSK